MSYEPIIRPVRPEDAADLRENCFSANTLEEIQADIEQRIKTFEQGIQVHLVAEVDGTVVGTGLLI